MDSPSKLATRCSSGSTPSSTLPRSVSFSASPESKSWIQTWCGSVVVEKPNATRVPSGEKTKCSATPSAGSDRPSIRE